jgi:hypothetical protein
MTLCAEVAGYELVLAKTLNEHWSVSLRGTGWLPTPLNEVYASLDEAKRHACVWATAQAGIPCTDELVERTAWRECRGY